MGLAEAVTDLIDILRGLSRPVGEK